MSKQDQNSEIRNRDPRFSGIQNDPKFRTPKNKKFKIKLDERFTKKDLEFKRKAKVDKYGRKVGDEDYNKDSKDFDKYFSKAEKSDGEEAESEETITPSALDRARGDVPSDYVSSSDGESSSESEEESADSEVESEAEEIVEEAPATGDTSKVLAIVNLDWDHVRAVDLMLTFNSFVPKGGKIERVCIYPSEFGKERMKREEVEGPPRELFKSKRDSKKSDGDDSDVDVRDLYEEGDAEKDYDSGALRRYQLERLRYYYAVVFCNNVETAEAIYQNCDGTEYESTANMFDLRYVPEDMSFDDEPKDECDTVPKDYKPVQFSTSALQHSQVKLTWDETPSSRMELTKRAFSQKELDDMDFKAYLASDSEESEQEVNEEAKNKLKSLVQDCAKVGEKSIFDKDAAENDELDMEITFTPGLEGEEKPDGSQGEDLSTIEKVRLKEKERRKKRKERVKELKKHAEMETKLSKQAVRPSTEEEKEAEEKKKAELELLMLDDDADADSQVNKKVHFNMKEILRSEKEKGKKTKYQDRKKIVEDDFKPDLNDPRFKEVFEDREFAIDPSQPEFKQTAAMKEILKERRKRSSKGVSKEKRKHSETHDDEGKGLSVLVNRIKNKSKKLKK